MIRKLILIGGISYGKGFCMNKIGERLPEMGRIIMGEYFRELRKTDPDFDREYGLIMDSGDLLPDKIVNTASVHLIKRAHGVTAIDGMCRNGHQVYELAQKRLIGGGDVACILHASRSVAKARHEHRVLTQTGGVRMDESWFDKRFDIHRQNEQAVVKALNESGVNIFHIDANTPLPHMAEEILIFASHVLNANLPPTATASSSHFSHHRGLTKVSVF